MPSLKVIADNLFSVKQEIDELNDQLAVLKRRKTNVEIQLVEALQTADLNQIRTDHATFSLQTSIRAFAQDWEAIGNYIIENRNISLLHRRVSDVEYRTLLELDGGVPGIKPYEKTIILTKRGT